MEQPTFQIGDHVRVGRAFYGVVRKIEETRVYGRLDRRMMALIEWRHGVPTWEPFKILKRVDPLTALAMQA